MKRSCNRFWLRELKILFGKKLFNIMKKKIRNKKKNIRGNLNACSCKDSKTPFQLNHCQWQISRCRLIFFLKKFNKDFVWKKTIQYNEEENSK